MYTTGKVYGLEVNSFIDQRRDPVLSTKAACRYLKDLYGIYEDWTLALAAYNCGPGNVNKAIKRAGDQAEDFFGTSTPICLPKHADTFPRSSQRPMPTPSPTSTTSLPPRPPCRWRPIPS